MSTGWRIANNAKVDEIVGEWTRHHTDEVVSQLTAREIPCSPIRDIREVAEWPHLRERGILQHLRHPRFPAATGPLAPAFPLKFSDSDADYRSSAPVTREHNDEIYRGVLGMSEHELRELSAEGVI